MKYFWMTLMSVIVLTFTACGDDSEDTAVEDTAVVDSGAADAGASDEEGSDAGAGNDAGEGEAADDLDGGSEDE